MRPDGWVPIRRELDIRALGINGWGGDTGAVLVPDHEEASGGHEETYIVIAGAASFTVAGETIDAPQGTIVVVSDPAAMRTAVADADGTLVVAVGAKPGEAFTPQPWETNRDLLPMFDRGEYPQIKEYVTAALERYDDHAALLYNLACAEANLGETDAALEHLAQACTQQDDLRDLAREDGDLAVLRDDPRFTTLIGAEDG